jgi:DNA-binding transcriptional regulator YdaS (Cro superfamily)
MLTPETAVEPAEGPSALEAAIQSAGGPSAFAGAIGGKVKAQHIINWRKRGVPPDRVKDIVRAARATGTDLIPHRLRPDLYPASFQFSDDELSSV